jgi:hypothetical protein
VCTSFSRKTYATIPLLYKKEKRTKKREEKKWGIDFRIANHG